MLSFYDIDWADVVRQSLPALRRYNQYLVKQGALCPAALEAASPRFVYAGKDNPMPQALLHDTRLTPLERNTWQVLRWLITERHVEAPRYQDLQPYLATSPCGAQASRETIARALNVLRSTRWLSLADRARDQQGCLRGSIYVLYDEPLSPHQALDVDSGYLALIRQNLSHATKGVRDLARHVLQELRDDAQVPADVLKGLDQAAERSAQQALPFAQPSNSEGSERTAADNVRNPKTSSATSPDDSEPPTLADVRNPNVTCTVLKSQSNKKTVPRAGLADAAAQWPETLQLSLGERKMAQQALHRLEPDQRQAVINEAVARCIRGTVRKPAAYLMGLIKRACNGEFTLWAARALTSEPEAARPRPSTSHKPRDASRPPREASPLALACLTELKQRCRVVSAS
ncbi:STY4528 family pathogenicity island replication protein [Pseudomonas silvicola]|nr:STY4528 family pathogenicity island replication protein [Pseudomonas silvicola]